MSLDKITHDLTVIKSNSTFSGSFTTSVSGAVTLSYGDLTSEQSNTPSHTYSDSPPYLINVKDIGNENVTGIAISGNGLTTIGISQFDNLTNLDVSNNLLNRASLSEMLVDLNYYGASNGTLDISSNVADTPWSADAITSYYELTVSKGWSVTGFEGLWTPSQVSTNLWVDAADASTITEVGGKISQWDDKSGFGNHAVQATGSNQPYYTSSDARNGGRPSVYNIVENRYMWFPSVSAKRIYMILYYGDGVSDTFWPNHHSMLNGPGPSGEWRLTGRVNANKWDASNDFDDAGTYRDGSTTDTKNELTVLPMPSTLWKFNSSVTRTQTWRILTNNQSWTYYDGGIGEMIFTDGSESLDTQQKIEGYLAHKWGLTSNLPIAHPYKTSAPLL